MYKIFFLLLILCNLSQPCKLLGQQAFGDSILRCIAENSIPIFDKYLKEISKDKIVKDFLTPDTVLDAGPEKSYFEDNIYYKSLDVQIRYWHPHFDTVTFQNDYILFSYPKLTSSGQFIRIDTPLLIHKSRIKPVYKKFDDFLKIDANDKIIAETIASKGNEYWTNKSIMFDIENVPVEKCLMSYHLKMDSNFRFDQFYNDSLACENLYTRNIWNEFLPTSCKIIHPKGFWNVSNGELIFYNEYGGELHRFSIKEYSDKIIKLSFIVNLGEYLLELKKMLE